MIRAKLYTYHGIFLNLHPPLLHGSKPGRSYFSYFMIFVFFKYVLFFVGNCHSFASIIGWLMQLRSFWKEQCNLAVNFLIFKETLLLIYVLLAGRHISHFCMICWPAVTQAIHWNEIIGSVQFLESLPMTSFRNCRIVICMTNARLSPSP